MGIDELKGVILLQEKPAKNLANKACYALPETSDRQDLEQAALWLRNQGAEVPFINDDGMLVISNYVDEDGNPDGTKHYEFIEAPAVLVMDDSGEVQAYSHHITEHYEIIAGF